MQTHTLGRTGLEVSILGPGRLSPYLLRNGLRF
jgi:hypothetical protein